MKQELEALGSASRYSDQYDPTLLEAIDRVGQREGLNPDRIESAFGFDLWHAFELSWLDITGRPRISGLTCHIPCHSPKMIESKSFKLYLNSFNQSRFESIEAVKHRIKVDLSACAEAEVTVDIKSMDSPFWQIDMDQDFECIDDVDASDFVYQVDPSVLSIAPDEDCTEKLCTHLFRSNCPVTHQPDWASIYLSYKGPKIDRGSLLKYWVSFRHCQDFHEHCLERMFDDLSAVGSFQSLTIMARFTRRGGLDINPIRSTEPVDPALFFAGRTWRQ